MEPKAEITSIDKPIFQSMHEQLGSDEKYDRFLTALQELLEKKLADSITQEGTGGLITAGANRNLGQYYLNLAESLPPTEKGKDFFLDLSLSLYKEAVRIYTNLLGFDDPLTIECSATLTIISSQLM